MPPGLNIGQDQSGENESAALIEDGMREEDTFYINLTKSVKKKS